MLVPAASWKQCLEGHRFTAFYIQDLREYLDNRRASKNSVMGVPDFRGTDRGQSNAYYTHSRCVILDELLLKGRFIQMS